MEAIRIVSYNLRCPSQDDGENFFLNRMPLIEETIKKRMPDIIGVQEATDLSRESLANALPEYVVVGGGRDVNRHGEGVAFLYRKDKFELTDLSTVWLSETPDVPGSYYENSDQSHCPRVLMSALFLPKDPSLSPFRVYNMHTDHQGARARLRAVEAMLSLAAKDNERAPLPQIFLGDFNAEPDSAEMQPLMQNENYIDVTRDIKITFHDYHNPNFAGNKIDYIFVSKGCKAEDAFLWTESKGGLYLSDHHPVEAHIVL